MFGNFNKIMDMLTLESVRGVSVNKRLELVKPKPKSLMNITLRVEKLSGKCLIEKENDLVLRNLVRILYHLFANYEAVNLPSITVTDVTGASYSGYVGKSTAGGLYSRSALNWFNQSDVGDANTGIVIGSGTTSPTRTDYALVSKIAHGTGVGQIYYNRQTYELLTDYSFRLNREFTNAGSDLSVAEAGLIYYTNINDTPRYLLLLRDTFTPISVTAGNGIRVRYTFSF
jgi:hypothetical protein